MTRPADAPSWLDDDDFAWELLPDKVWAMYVSSGGEGVTKTDTGEPVPYVEKAGLIITHRCTQAPSGWDRGALMFALPGTTGTAWRVDSWEPLTLSPSVQHNVLGQKDNCPLGHGFIKNGVWVMA